MQTAEKINSFHKLAKDAGNRLKGYILSYSSGGTGVFFLALTGVKEAYEFSFAQKFFLIFSLLFFVATVAICLLELNLDARRFFEVAKQWELPESERDWGNNGKFKVWRLRLLYSSYVTCFLGTLFATLFLFTKIL